MVMNLPLCGKGKTMITAYKSLKLGLEADISVMAANNFVETDHKIIEDIFLCIKIVNLGRNALSEKIWLEVFKMYGFNSYGKITQYMEKQAKARDKATINISRNFSLERKRKLLKKYAYQIPEFKTIHYFKNSHKDQYLEYA